MRLKEFTESLADDQALWATARLILKPLSRLKGAAMDQYEAGAQIGTIGSLAPSAPKNIHNVIIQYAPGETSEYFASNSTSDRRDLIKNYDAKQEYILLGGSSYGLDATDVRTITSQLAHEMRHALDQSLSNGRFRGSHGRGATAYRGQDQIKDRSHEHRPLEINAHYTEALADIEKAVKSTTTTQQLHKIITQVFRNHWVGKTYRYDLQDPNYRRLFNRAVQYAETVIASKREKLAQKGPAEQKI
jgi:hypothetical protein